MSKRQLSDDLFNQARWRIEPDAIDSAQQKLGWSLVREAALALLLTFTEDLQQRDLRAERS
jgi:hypothetical protein